MEFDLSKNKAVFNVYDMLLGYPAELPLTGKSIQDMHAINEREAEASRYRKKHGFSSALAMNSYREEHDNAAARRRLTEQFTNKVVEPEVQSFRLELDAFNLDNEGPSLGQE